VEKAPLKSCEKGFHFLVGGFHVSLVYGRSFYGSNVPYWEFEFGPIQILIHKLPWEKGTWSKSKLEDWQKRKRYWRIFRRVGVGFLGSSIYFNLWKLKLAINIILPPWLTLTKLNLLNYLCKRGVDY